MCKGIVNTGPLELGTEWIAKSSILLERDLREKLFNDCKMANVESVRSTLSANRNLDINMVDGVGMTLLYYACRSSSEQMITMLVKDFNADINFRVQGYRNCPVLIYAITNNALSIVKLLLSFENLNLDFVNNGGVLHFAAAVGSSEILSLLLDQKTVAVNTTDNRGRTPLMISASKGQGFSLPTDNNVTRPALISNESFLSCMNLLLAFSDIDVNLTDTEGLSALSIACSCRFFQAIGELLKYPDINVNCKSRNANTPLILVCRSLEGSGSATLGANSMHKSDALECVRLLLDRNDVDVNAVNDAGNTALITASKFSDCVDLLLSREGIDVNVVNNQGLSALEISLSNGIAAVAKKLLGNVTIKKNIAKINSFVLLAVKNNFIDVLEVLLSIDGLNINEANSENETPLVVAIRANKKECIQKLLADKRVDVNVQVFVKYAAPNLSNYSDLPVGDSFVTKDHEHPLKLISSLLASPPSCCSKCSTTFRQSGYCSQCVNDMTCYALCPECTSQARGPQVNAPKMLTSTLLIDSIVNKNYEISQLLLGRDDIDINACDDDGNTALIIAASMNTQGLLPMNEKMSPAFDPVASSISMILSKAVNTSWSNTNGHSALQFACAKNRIDAVKR